MVLCFVVNLMKSYHPNKPVLYMYTENTLGVGNPQIEYGCLEVSDHSYLMVKEHYPSQ